VTTSTTRGLIFLIHFYIHNFLQTHSPFKVVSISALKQNPSFLRKANIDWKRVRNTEFKKCKYIHFSKRLCIFYTKCDQIFYLFTIFLQWGYFCLLHINSRPAFGYWFYQCNKCRPRSGSTSMLFPDGLKYSQFNQQGFWNIL
jgi:hypothetical protein